MLILFWLSQTWLVSFNYKNRCFSVALCCGVVTFLVVWIFLMSLGVICYGRWVLSVCHKNYFRDWCIMNSQPTFLFPTYGLLFFINFLFFHQMIALWKLQKMFFYFIWKALFVLEIFNFLQFFTFFSTIPKSKRTNGNGIIYDVMN